MSEAPQLGDRIQELRKQKGLTLTELARQASISKGYLSQIERGEAGRPSAQVLYVIASVLGTSVASLLGMPIGDADAEVMISESLGAFAKAANLSDDEVAMLARVRYRGRQPQTVEDWRYLYESIKRSLSGSD
jgi:transcriptional regulator with XRE-family HTH domain